MDEETLRRFAEFAAGPERLTIIDADGNTLEEVEVIPGRLDGGWWGFGPEGVEEVGVFWQEPGGPLESVTTKLRDADPR